MSRKAEDIEMLVERYSPSDKVVDYGGIEVSSALPMDAGGFMLQSRLHRAATNQIDEGEATLSRYAIWAETCRGLILDALATSTDPKAGTNLVAAANSLACFAEIQRLFDAERGG